MTFILVSLTLLSTLLFVSSNALAHSQDPGYEKHYSGPVFTKSYTVTNYPTGFAKYEWFVLEKDYTPATGWRVDKRVVATGGGDSKTVHFKFKVDTERKLLVCSKLVEMNNEKPSISSVVCSRIWLKRIR